MRHEIPDKVPVDGAYKYTYSDGEEIPSDVRVVRVHKSMNGRVRLVVVKVDIDGGDRVKSASTP